MQVWVVMACAGQKRTHKHWLLVNLKKPRVIPLSSDLAKLPNNHWGINQDKRMIWYIYIFSRSVSNSNERVEKAKLL